MKKALAYVLLILHLSLAGNFWVILPFLITKANAASTTLSYVGTARNIATQWNAFITPTNAQWDTTTTSTTASFNGNGKISDTLALTNFNLAAAWLPSNASINGIKAEVEFNTDASTITNNIQLTKSGTLGIGTNKAVWVTQTAKAFRTYGGVADLWGSTWTATELLSANFWILINFISNGWWSHTASVYRVRITIEYTAAVNWAPTNILLSNNTINEWQPVGTTIGLLSTVDPDVWNTHSYSFACAAPWADNASFAISWNNLNSKQIFNQATKSTYNICIRTTDQWGLSFDKNFVITVNALNCAVNDVTIQYNTDSWWYETFWSLTPSGNACGVGQIASGWNTTQVSCTSWGTRVATTWNGYASNANITTWPFSLTVWATYNLYVVDDYGDGIATTDPDVSVFQNWVSTNSYGVLWNWGVYTFTVQKPSGCNDTKKPSVTINQSPSQTDPTQIDSATFRVIFDEPISLATFTASDITLTGTTGTVTSWPTQIAPNNATSFEFTVSGMTYGTTVTATIPAWGVQDLSSNTNNASTSTDNSITFNWDTTPPVISSFNYASGSLLPGWTHTLTVNYNDNGSGINQNSTIKELYKWNGTDWWTDISATSLSNGTKSSSSASYSTNNLNFWKYLFVFRVSDNAWNNSTIFNSVFYIDRPIFTIWNEVIDIWNISANVQKFSPWTVITVKTIWAPFKIIMNRNGDFTDGNTNIIQNWNGTKGYWYDLTPLTWTITPIASDELIKTQSKNINTNGDLNTYTYNLHIWAEVDTQQAAWDYLWKLDFKIQLDY